MNNIAMIGSRRLSTGELKFFQACARALARRGKTIITGGCAGADYAAMQGVREIKPTNLILVLPWWSYESQWHLPTDRKVVFDSRIDTEWAESVERYHPAPHNLTQGGRKLMARNYGIVSLSDVVIAFPAKDRTGGTEQGIKIAQDLGRKLFIIESKKDMLDLKDWIESMEITVE